MNWTRRRLLACTVGVGTAALAGCLDDGQGDRALPDAPAGTWQQTAHDASNTGVSAVSVPPRGTPAWNSGDTDRTPPVVAGETVFTVGDSLTALEGRTGDRKWQTTIESDQSQVTAPGVTAEDVLLGTEGGIVGFAREDGTKQWELPVDGIPIGSVTVAPDDDVGVVPFERPEGGRAVVELVAFDTAGSQRHWTVPLFVSSRTTPPAIHEVFVYAAGYTGDDTPVLRAFSLVEGIELWEQELADPETPPVATSAGVFLGDSGAVTVYSHADGQGDRTIDVPGDDPEIRALAATEDRVFVLSNGGLAALSTEDGAVQWQVDTQPRADGIAVGRDTVVAPVSGDIFDLETAWPCIAAFDRSTGTTQWYHAIDDAFDPRISAPPVIADGAVFCVSNTKAGVTALGDLPPREE